MPARHRILTVLALIAVALSLVAAAEQSNSWSIFGPARPEGHTRSGGWRGSRVVVPTPAPAPVEEPQPAAPQPAQDEYTPTNVEDVGAADAPTGGPKTAVAESGPAAVEATPMAVTEADPVAVEAYPVQDEAQAPAVVEAQPVAAEAQPVAVEEALAPQPVVDEAGAAPAQTDAAAQPQAGEQQDGQQAQAEGQAQQSEGAEQQQEADQEDTNAPKLTAASGEGASTTQAGCACLENWEDAQGNTHTGCTNPTNDPQGAWCAVDPQQCPGFYSVYRDRMSRIVHYDYCSEVRERTTNGCLCDAEWKLEGYGKEIYRNRCAHPDNETTRKCRVNAATCPPGVTLEGSYDTCTPASGRATPAVMRTRTFNGCNCLNGGWWYLYPGNDAPENPIAPINKTIFGCSNPDGDPLGAWCAVNPGSCDRFVGYIRMDAKTTWAFDYCDSKRPGALVLKRNGCRPDAIPEWGQCGGKSNCSEWGCADEQWAGACCGNALICDRQDPYYWQCIKPGTRMNTQGPAALAGAAGDSAPANEAGLAAGSSQVVSALPGIGGAYPLPPVESPSLPAFSGPGLPALKRRGPGATVYVNLKINYPYELLIADVGAQARFKSDVVGWLKSAAGPAEFVYGAGVDEIVNGSVVAAAHVVYTADAPEELVSKAPAAIKTGAERLYKSSALPASWGPLMAMESAANRNSLTLRPSEQSAIPVQQLGLCPGGDCAAGAAAAAAPARGPARWWQEFLHLPPGMYAGMGGGALMVLLVTIIIARVVARALVANRGVDADKDAQLAYMNEMTEGDLHTELDGTVKADSIVDPGPIGTRQNRLLLWLGGLPQPEEEEDEEVEIALAHIQMPSKTAAPKAPYLADETGEIAASPRSQTQGTFRNPAAPDGPDPAFLPLPDGEGVRRISGPAGAAPASLTHRRVSAAAPPAAPAAATLAPPPQARVAVSSGGGIGGALGRLGSAVANLVSGGGAAPAVEEAAEGSDKPAKKQ